MEDDELAKHIPYYPDPRTDVDYNARAEKLHELSVLCARCPQKSEIFFNHQTLSQRFLGVQTPNRTLFIYKDPGVGKTLDAIGIAETRHEWLKQVLPTDDPILKNAKGDLYKAVIVAQNATTKNDNFKRDIIARTEGSYITEVMAKKTYKDESRKLQAKTRSINTAYDLTTHTAFANALEKMTNEEISKKYSFRIIIIDEIHNYKTLVRTKVDHDGNIKTVGKKQIYDRTMRLIDNVYGCVIVVLSATPIVNDINEFPAVINFILPKEDRIDPEVFRHLTATDDPAVLRQRLEEHLIPKLRGRVSRMGLPKTLAKTVVRTNEDPSLYINSRLSTRALWLTKISNNNPDGIDYIYIMRAYYDAYNIDVKGNLGGIYINSLMTDNMVWPGGQIGTQAANRNIVVDLNRTARFTDAFMQDFRLKITNTRRFFITRAQREKEVLRQRLVQLEAANPNANFREIEAKMDVLDAEVEDYTARINLHPEGTFDNSDDLDLQTMLHTIRVWYSPVYADTIQQIIGIEYYNNESQNYEYIVTAETNTFNLSQFDENDKDNRECAYVYNYFLAGGIIPFGLLMEFFGYSYLPDMEGSYVRADGTPDGKINLGRGKRYALLYSASSKKKDDAESQAKMTDARARRILELFNHPDNKYGHYLKVVAGTDVSAQGINFRNVRQGHFTGRGWNEATNIQAEGRIDRPGDSHRAFDDDDPVPVFTAMNAQGDVVPLTVYNVIKKDGKNTQKYVKLFRHVAYYPEMNITENGVQRNVSIGIKMYDDAARKELKISIPTTIMARIAYDYTLNIQDDAGLEHTPLAYALNGQPDQYKENYVNYNIFHARKEIEYIKCRIRGYFKTYFRLGLSRIIRLLPDSHYSTIIKALTEMVNDNERIVDGHGMLNYLREENDIFFLQKMPRALRSRQEQWMSYYSQHNFIDVGVNLSDFYFRLQQLATEKSLRAIQMTNGDMIQIGKIIQVMSNKSKGMLVETLVNRYRALMAAGVVNSTLLASIFESLSPNVVYAPQNMIIIHLFDLKATRESSGSRTVSGKVPAESSRELRIYVIREGVWRNSTPSEDHKLIPIINDHIERSFSAKIKQHTHYGTLEFKKDGFIFRLQNRLYFDQSTSKTTQKGARNLKAATKDGQQVTSIPSDSLLWYLDAVRIDLCVLVRIYDPMLVNNKMIKPVVMVKLKRDPKGPHLCNNEKMSPDVDAQGKPYILKNAPGIDINKFRSEHILHYTRIYPEILGWIFTEELAKADPNTLNPNNPIFFPLYGDYQPRLQPYYPGYNHYTSLLGLLPWEKGEILDNLLGVSIVGSKTGRVDYGVQTLDFSADSVMAKSLNLLYDYLLQGIDMDVYDYTFKYPRTTVNITLTIGRRFASVWKGGVTNRNLSLVIYIAYYLTGRLEAI